MSVKKRPILQAAAAVAAVAKTDGVYVYSSLDSDILKAKNSSAYISKMAFAKATCEDCTTEFSALKDIATPYCIVCGSEHIKQSVKASAGGKVTFPSDDKCVYVTCGSCKANHVLQQSVLASLGGVVHCTVCGEEVDAEEQEPVEEEEDTGDGADESLPTEAAEDDEHSPEEEEDELETVDHLGDEGHEEDELDTVDHLGDEGHEDEKAEPIDLDGNPREDKVPEPKETGPAITKAEAIDLDGNPRDDKVPNPESEKSDEVCIDVLEHTKIDDDEVTASLVDLGTSLVIIHKNQVMASMKETTAGANKDLWGTEALQIAIANHLKQHGIKKTVAAFKFTPTRIRATLNPILAAKVSKGVAAETAQLKKNEQQLADTFKQSLEIATVGINKDFWKGVNNPLKSALVAELSSIGIRKPEQLIARVFDKHGLTYAAALITQAQLVMEKSLETRNELATTLDMVNTSIPQVTASDEENDGDEDEDDGEYGDEIHAGIRAVRMPESATLLGSPKVSPKGSSVIASLLQSRGKAGDLFSA